MNPTATEAPPGPPAEHVLLWKPTPQHPLEVQRAVTRYREAQIAGRCPDCGAQDSGEPRILRGHTPTCFAQGRVYGALAKHGLAITDVAWEVVHLTLPEEGKG
ncbi:MAG: hypothetical protein M3470_10510 [Chloroflexota bacterium]|nr:hypothetical protein [Chloroflexota bacterium]